MIEQTKACLNVPAGFLPLAFNYRKIYRRYALTNFMATPFMQ